MAENNEKILNILKNRKITEKSLKDIKNKKNTPKDYNIFSEFIKKNLEDKNNEADNILKEDKILASYKVLDGSFEDFCSKNTLIFDNVKRYSSLLRILNGEYLNKWKPLYRRLIMASKLNSEIDPELSLRLKSDAKWLKLNSKDLVLIHKSNMYDKSSPSLKNLENYKVYMLPTKELKYKLTNKNDNLVL